ncbi:MAG: hypothetical protein IPP33_12605 [Flavobacteriales bacterium]|nr:hypothetical protein [Flavobacteriales bacterium]
MINRSLFLLIVMLGPKWLFGQGCSDAGVCTAGPTGQLHLWQDSTADVVDYRHMARLGFSYALGEQSTTIMQLNPEISIGIGPKLSVAFKIPYVFTSGKLGNNSGPGDAIITTSFAFIKEEDRNLTGVLGVRLPTGTTDAEWDGVSTQLQARSFAHAVPDRPRHHRSAGGHQLALQALCGQHCLPARAGERQHERLLTLRVE